MGTIRDIYDAATYEEVVGRIERLTADTPARWGTMSAAQTCAHCSEIAEVSNGKPLSNTPWIARLFAGMIRKMVVGPKPYPRNTKTHPQYVITDALDFEEQKARLLGVLGELKAAGPNDGRKHPLFGAMTDAEKGWAGYKHLDHHLRQFGV